MVQNLIDNWLGWLGLSATTITILSFLPGITILTSGLKIVASLFEMVSPIVGGAISGLLWLWKTILLPGLLDILDSIATIITVVILIGSMFIFIKLNDDIRYNNLQRQYQAVKNKRPPEDVPQESLWEFKLPWLW